MIMHSEAPAGPADGSEHDVVVVGASAGGVEALRALVAGLPPDLRATVLVVLHLPREAPSALPAILDRAGPLPARHAIDGEEMRYGHVYIAPVDHHLLVLDGRMRLSRGPSENGHRPAIDPLFRTAARSYGPRVVGIVLSGSRDDGADGAAVVARHGGVTIVQDPTEALYGSMPLAAMRMTRVDHVLPVGKIGPLLGELGTQPVTDQPVRLPPDRMVPAEVDAVVESADGSASSPDTYGCPTCGGGLVEIQSEPVPRYRCRVGHVWSPDSLLEEHTAALESALWMALRALEEKSDLSAKLSVGGRDRGDLRTARTYQSLSDEARRASTLIREVIARLGSGDGGMDVE
ncbi:MAG: two-component system, chemotaxis family, protein-glutamate methylesterase/glutaminase [Micromonosporaceae bacterium]